MNARLLVFLLLWPFAAFGQGFAGLGSDADGFALPQRGYAFDFPTDHGAHPAYRIEWWYVTANLTGDDGAQYGVQWTLFRSALAPEEAEGWDSPQVWMGHAALTTEDAHYTAERFGRGGIGQAGASEQELSAWIDDWELDFSHMTASGTDWRYDLSLSETGPLVFHGDEGYSVKSAGGQASYYYSQPFLEVEGILTIGNHDIHVTGNAWLDREWSSQPLAQDQSGWDWFSLSFDDGDKLMGFRLRGTDTYTSATWIDADGGTTAFADGAFMAEPLENSPTSGPEVPVRWQVQLPERGLDVTVSAINPDSWMPLTTQYWEGPVTVTGTHTGRGYLEMTGYE